MAVYTQLTNEQIAALTEGEYGLGPLQFALGIAQGVENSNYLVATGPDERKSILTLYEKRVDATELPFFLELMQHVAARGVHCPQPIATKSGALSTEVMGKPAALVTFLEGKSRSLFRNEHVASVGDALGQLHVATKDFKATRANALALDGWKKLYAKISGRLDEIQPGLNVLVGEEIAYLEKHMPQGAALPRGIIHADLFPDNVFFLGDDVSGLIDFYFACEDALAYDLAITLNAWCFDGKEGNLTKMKHMAQAYQKLRALTAEEKAAMPVLLRGAALRFLLTRAHDLLHQEKSALVTPKDPHEYLNKLRFHQRADAATYGFLA